MSKDKTFYQIIDKKANLNAIESSGDTVSMAYIFITFLCSGISIVMYYYCYEWYQYLIKYVEGMNVRSIAFLDIFFESFNVMHITNWPPSQLTSI